MCICCKKCKFILTASIKLFTVGDLSINASKTSSDSFLTYSRTVKKQS